MRVGRILATLLLVGTLAGCCSTCHDCGWEDPCACGPCCTTIDVVDQNCCQESCCEQSCCGKSGWWKRLFHFRGKDGCCQSECCQNSCCQDGGCCQFECGCTPRRYTWCGYDQRHDDRAVCAAADRCAGRAIDHYEETRGDVCRDFRCGFRDGYRNVALGGDGRVPAVPSQAYWQACRRTECGHDRTARWYDGFEWGAHYALNDGQQPYRRIAAPAGAMDPSLAHPPYPGERFSRGGPIAGANPYPPHAECRPTYDHTTAAWDGTEPVDAVLPSGGVESGEVISNPAEVNAEVIPPLWPY